MSSYEDAIHEITSKKNLDLDLPNFTPTKYNKTGWKIIHFFTYFLFGLLYLLTQLNNLFQILKKYQEIISIVGSFSYLLSSFLEWRHFRRGCCGKSNLNYQIKGNIDKSFSAKMKRSEIGLKYFLNIIVTIILLVNDILHIFFSNDLIYYILMITGMALLVITQLLKIEKILTNTKQYQVKNDLSNSIVEILNFSGAMIYFTCFLLYLFNEFKDLSYVLIIGSICFILSSFVLYYRYFHSGFEDLNVSESSFISIKYE